MADARQIKTAFFEHPYSTAPGIIDISARSGIPPVALDAIVTVRRQLSGQLGIRSSRVAWPLLGVVLQLKDETGCDADQAGAIEGARSGSTRVPTHTLCGISRIS